MLSFYLLLLNILQTAFSLSNETDPYHQLIVIAENSFSIDTVAMEPDDFTTFLQKDNSKEYNLETIYINEDNPDDTLRNRHYDKGDPLIVLRKGEDGLPPSQKLTYVVLRQVSSNTKRYTAHLAYIRNIDGKRDIEWDNYNPSIKRENANFIAAFSPFDSKCESLARRFVEQSSSPQMGRSMASDAFPFKLFANKGSESSTSLTGTTKSPIFDQMELAHLQEVGKLAIPTSVSASSKVDTDNNSGKMKTSISDFKVRLKCPLNSGAILVGRKCYCPYGTVKTKNKCLKQGEEKKNGSKDESASFESKESNSNSSDSHNTINVNLHCPTGSGSVLVKQKCVCPEGTVLNDKKCVSNKTTSGKDNQVKNRVRRNPALLKSKPVAKAKSSGKTPKTTTTVRPTPTKPSIPVTSAPKGRSMAAIVLPTTTPPPIVFNFTLPKGRTSGSTGPYYNVGRRKIVPTSGDQSIPGSFAKNVNKFEDTTPYTGFLLCEYDRPKENVLVSKANTSDVVGAIVDFYLASVRAQCHHEIEANTLRLFEKNIVMVGDDFKVNLNSAHNLLKKRVFSVMEWNSVISAIFLSTYTEAYRDQIENSANKVDISKTFSPDGNEISHSIHTLTLMVDSAVKLLQKEMKFHSIKFVNSITAALNERLLKVLKEKEQILLDCNECDDEQLVLNQNEIQLRALLDFIRYILSDFRRLTTAGAYTTFSQYYVAKIAGSNKIAASNGLGRSMAAINPVAPTAKPTTTKPAVKPVAKPVAKRPTKPK